MAEPLATITPIEGLGMITIRADLTRAGDAIAEAAGLDVPEALKITTDGSRSLGWMSPDELLLVVPVQETASALASLHQVLSTEHSLIADVSDARVVFDITGTNADDVIAKLSPADLSIMSKDGLRRSRAAQTAAAFWRINKGFRLIGFRSTADYLALILQNATIPGSQLAPR